MQARGKAFVKVTFSIWAPMKFLYVYLKNKEQLTPGVTCETNYMRKNWFFQAANTRKEMPDELFPALCKGACLH